MLEFTRPRDKAFQTILLVLACFCVLAAAFVMAPADGRFGAILLACILLSLLVLLAVFLIPTLARPGSQAQTTARHMHQLYDLTRRTLHLDLHSEPGPQMVTLLQEIFSLEAVAIFDADLHEVYQAGHWTTDPSEMAQNIYHFETSDDDPHTGISRRVIRLGTVPIGSVVLRGETTALSDSAIAALIAITFDRYRALANESRIEAERHAEQMRATVLDSLAHAYKTPLTAIRAASSGLCEMGHLSPSQADLVALIDEQASLLDELTNRLLTTARLEAGNPPSSISGDEAAGGLHPTLVAAAPLLDEAIATLGERCGRSGVRIDIAEPDLLFRGDRGLLIMLLTQYLDNACKYSDPDSVITLRAARVSGEVLFSVHSYGPVIPMADRERIFDRYFRSAHSSARAPGTGIGLSIAKRAALAHGGSVWVSSDAVDGTTFFAAIPADQSAPLSSASRAAESAVERSTP